MPAQFNSTTLVRRRWHEASRFDESDLLLRRWLELASSWLMVFLIEVCCGSFRLEDLFVRG